MIGNAYRALSQYEAAESSYKQAEKCLHSISKIGNNHRFILSYCRACLLHDRGELEKAAMELDTLMTDTKKDLLTPLDQANTHFQMAWIAANRAGCEFQPETAKASQIKKAVDELKSARV